MTQIWLFLKHYLILIGSAGTLAFCLRRDGVRFTLGLLLLLGGSSASAEEIQLSPGLKVFPGTINRALIGAEDARLAVYGVPPGHEIQGPIFLTHGRRDAIPVDLPADVDVLAPLEEKPFLAEPEKFWQDFATGRFHDYAQQSTKILAEAIPVRQWMQDGEIMTFHGVRFRVLATPGYTRGALSYLAEIDGKKTAFTGDLIYGEGKIFDLYSFQDRIPGAQIGGYHGYGSRLALLMTSLGKLEEEDLDVIVPLRGPVIREPDKAIRKLRERVEALYRNYLSTTALHWYFKEKRMRLSGERVLGRGAEIDLMPFCHYEETPDWIFTESTSRLLISETGAGFLLDCGYQRVIDTVQKLIDEGTITKVEGIFVTHFHDDHADMVQAAAEHFSCPVYALEEYKDVLENPAAYHLPAMTSNAIKNVIGMKDGEKLSWREMDFTFHFYPGQTVYHGGLFVKKEGEKLLCFIGDSFSPSGIDDYCVLNRNLLHEDSGYLLCLKKLRDLTEDYWIINEHIPHVFKFSDEEMDYLETSYRQRIEIQRELFPWDDPNYGVDEQWAVFYPYGAKAGKGAKHGVSLRLTNHSPVNRTFELTFRGSHGMKVSPQTVHLKLSPRQQGAIDVMAETPEEAGQYLITADVKSEGMDFERWTESMVIVE